jgi:hypothetical protein
MGLGNKHFVSPDQYIIEIRKFLPLAPSWRCKWSQSDGRSVY